MQNIRLNLGPIRKVLDCMGSPHKKIPVISVAGTNGKGSVCSFLKAIAGSAGIKTGLYTSPHFKSFRERIQIKRSINNIEYGDIKKEILRAQEKAGERLTRFEFLTAAAITYFFEKGCELNIMEAGMGGRLDATNICENKLLSVITPVDIDHSRFLGSKREKIAGEKAGIIKKNIPVIDFSGTRSVEEKALNLNAPLRKYKKDFIARDIKKEEEGFYSFNYYSPSSEIKELRPSLRGKHQCRNAAAAAAAAEMLDIISGEVNIRRGIGSARLPGRLQFIKLKKMRTVILDTAHNPAACRALGRFMEDWQRSRLYTVAGILKDKEYGSMMRLLSSFSHKIFTFSTPGSRGLDGDTLAASVKNARSSSSFSEACRSALKVMEPGSALLICGSFKAIELAMDFFCKDKNEKA